MMNKLKNKTIPLSEPFLCGNEWKYVKECFDTGWVSSSGKYVETFEKITSRYVGRKYGVACASCTAALHISLILAGIGPEDEVIMPVLTFVAPANAVRYTGAYPVFMDVCLGTWQLDIEKVAVFLKKECRWGKDGLVNKHTRRKVKAILPVHVMGHPVDMDSLMDIAREYGLAVIEDAAESLGAEYRGKKVGRHGIFACLSFNGNKVITCGGGGMIVADDKELAERARYLTTQAKDDPIENIHGAVGYNYRLTNIQAAMGVAQMEQIERYILKKRKIALLYRKGLEGIPGIIHQAENHGVMPSYWLYTVLIDNKLYGRDSRALMSALKSNGIEARPFWHPLYSQKIFTDCYAYEIIAADRIYADGLSLPSSVNLSLQDQKRVIALIRSAQR
ncbi:MAG: LegC family aminotransferase [Candidatus Omnitrophota bacterium]